MSGAGSLGSQNNVGKTTSLMTWCEEKKIALFFNFHFSSIITQVEL